MSNEALKALTMGNFSGLSMILALGIPLLAPFSPVKLQAAGQSGTRRDSNGILAVYASSGSLPGLHQYHVRTYALCK